MKLLLDTHAFLWFVQGSSRLSPRAQALIEDEANMVDVNGKLAVLETRQCSPVIQQV